MPSITIRPAAPADGPLIAKFNALMALETEHRTLEHKVLRLGVEAVLVSRDVSRAVWGGGGRLGHWPRGSACCAAMATKS